MEERLREQPLLHQQEDDEEATKPAVAVEEGVDRLELVVDQGDLDERRDRCVLVDKSFEVTERALHVVDGRRDEDGRLDAVVGRAIQFCELRTSPGRRSWPRTSAIRISWTSQSSRRETGRVARRERPCSRAWM